jgi:PAS domain S-box-containing protein
MSENNQSKKIRQLAEEQVQKEEAVSKEISSDDLHELRVHQIELEMQTEELMSSQEALSASRELYFNLYDLAPIGYCTLSKQGTIIETNLTTALLLGADRSVLIGKAFTSFIFSEDQDTYYLYNKKVIKTTQVESCELRMQKLDGTQFWGRLEAILMNDVKANPVIRIVISDVSSREQQLLELNADLKKACDQAECASRAKSAFLANMSHELRTPLNGVLGFTQLLEMEDLAPKYKGYLNYISQSGKNLLALINDILDLSKAEAEKIELCHEMLDIQSIIEEIISTHNLKAVGKNISLNKAISSDLHKIYTGDSHRLKQILNNLFSNAIKFTKVGHVSVSVNLISKNVKSDVVQFVVSDTGIGMTPETLGIIFQPFSQADSNITRDYGGTGLGLAISKKLVELMRGQIKVKSVLGKGSTFSFEIPLLKSEEQITPNEKIKNYGENSQFKKIKVLLIEDNPTNLQLGIEILGVLGCKANTAERATDALVLLETEKFDLLLIDIQMPGMSGDEMIKLIRKKEMASKNHQMAIALTAYALQGDKEQYLQAGFDGYISKPIEIDVLVREMERVLKH